MTRFVRTGDSLSQHLARAPRCPLCDHPLGIHALMAVEVTAESSVHAPGDQVAVEMELLCP